MASKGESNGASAETPVYTLAEGQPVADPTTSLQVQYPGSTGGLSLLSDVQLVETLAHFARERIPERVVHAKAAGAWGEFEVTNDISDLTDAAFLTGVGKKTPVLARISTVAGEKGSSDTARDIRGFAVKLFTEEGNQDFVFNDLPVFFIRDPVKFPSMNRSHKRHPQTAVPDSNMFWDFHVNNQEGIHALIQLFGPRGIPESLRNVNGFGVHTYTLSKQDGSYVYIKWHFKPDAGIKTMDGAKAVHLAGAEPDYHVKDMYAAIARGDFPTWTLHIQVMKPEDVKDSPVDIFDVTFTWPHEKYPLIPVGKLTLNKNPHNYFQDIEQAAFSPSNMVPGIGPSADTVLQARIFSYPDAARYRVGTNYQQLPPNKPHSKVYSPYERDGPMTINGNYDGDPDYVRSSLRPVKLSRHHQAVTHEQWQGQAYAYASGVTDKDFEQPRELWEIMKKEGVTKQFFDNITPTLVGIVPDLQKRAIEYLGRVSPEISEGLEKRISEADQRAAKEPMTAAHDHK